MEGWLKILDKKMSKYNNEPKIKHVYMHGELCLINTMSFVQCRVIESLIYNMRILWLQFWTRMKPIKAWKIGCIGFYPFMFINLCKGLVISTAVKDLSNSKWLQHVMIHTWKIVKYVIPIVALVNRFFWLPIRFTRI